MKENTEEFMPGNITGELKRKAYKNTAIWFVLMIAAIACKIYDMEELSIVIYFMLYCIVMRWFGCFLMNKMEDKDKGVFTFLIISVISLFSLFFSFFAGGFILLYFMGCVAIIYRLRYIVPDRKKARFLAFAFLLFAYFLPQYDIYISKYYFNSHSGEVLEKIDKTVEYPESVHWEDNVWPGFDRPDRERFLKSRLDGVHLQKLAVNSKDGRIYLYTAGKEKA